MLQDVVAQFEKTIKESINQTHTALPGEIISFNPDKAVAVVKPKGKFLTPERKKLEYPKISDVPVLFPYCQPAGVGIAFPVKPGDSCIIIVSEVELDEWRSGAEAEGSLRYDLTNAVAITGLMKAGGGIVREAYSQDAVVVVSGNTKMTLSGTGIAIRGKVTVDGEIICTGDVKAGSVSLQNHVHTSAEAGSTSSKPS